MTRRTQAGFTLIEMMMVVAIIAVLSGVMIGLSTRTHGANPMNMSEEISGAFNLCKMRAVSTRRWHRCEITPTALTVYQWSNPGMVVPTGSCTPPTTNCFLGVERITIPSGISIWDASSSIDIAGGVTVTKNTSMDFYFDFRPDGSSTGGTVFITDTAQRQKYRVLVYKSTGSSYARQNW